MEPSTDGIDLERLERYAVGDVTPAERAAVERHLAEDREASALFAALSATLGDDGANSPDSYQSLSITAARLNLHLPASVGATGQLLEAAHPHADVGTRARSVSVAPSTPVRARRLTVGAIVSLCAIAIALCVRGGVFSSAPDSQGALVVYTTNRAQRATVTLPDGSHVVLAPSTTLTVRGRQVQLSGEALFVVAPHPSAAFVVTANGVSTRVLGTEFGVRAYDRDVTVAVRTGRVAVGDSVLGAQDIATITGSITRVVHHAPVDGRLAFAEGALIIDNLPMRDAVADLNRWFDVDVRIAPALADTRLIATFTDLRPSALAEQLRIALHSTVTRDGRTVTVAPR